jgi:Tat protein secretion system quality control protein TatD with DNase activity
VVETAAFVAAARGVEPLELEATLERNAAELFGW